MSRSCSSFKHNHSPSTDTRKLHRYMVSWAPDTSSMAPPTRPPMRGSVIVLALFDESERIVVILRPILETVCLCHNHMGLENSFDYECLDVPYEWFVYGCYWTKKNTHFR